MNKLISVFAVLLLVFALAAVTQADSNKGWDPTEKDQMFFTLQSKIMSIDYAQNKLVVAEREVELFNEREKGQELSTMLRNSYGGKIEWRSLHRGDMVFIRGFEQSGAPVLAREIYLLPAGNRTTNLPFQKTVPDWTWRNIEKK